MTASPESPSNRRRLLVNSAGAGVLLLIAVAMWNWQPGGAPGSPGPTSAADQEPRPDRARDLAHRSLPGIPHQGPDALSSRPPDGARAAPTDDAHPVMDATQRFRTNSGGSGPRPSASQRV